MPKNLAETFFLRAAQLSDAPCVRFKEGKGPYRDASWTEYSSMIREMAAGLASLGLDCGERAAILSPTSHMWVACDLSILANSGVSVPVYPTSSTSDIEFILKNSGSQFVYVAGESLLKKVLASKAELPEVKKIILITAPAKGRSLSELNQELGADDGFVIGLEELQQLGREYQEKTPELIETRIAKNDRDDLATIIYTSGTTGLPKGVRLTHGNIMSVLDDLVSVIPLTERDIYLSFLPLSHVFERVCGEFYWMHSGGVCAFAEGMEAVAKNMAEVDPTMILVVPRVLDRIYAKVKSGIQGASPRARKLIEWSLAVGAEMVEHASVGKKPRQGLLAKHWLAEKLVLRKLRARIGSRLRLVVCGGAPATAEVIQFFNSIGITTLEGYGLTETSAPASVNRVTKIKAGTVGPTLPSVDAKLASDGEILLRGPSVFTGYFKSDEATAEAFEDGWFRSGDIGVIDNDGYIKITDRKKDLIVNSAGKNIAPQKVEAVLKTVPFVTQAIVFGDKKKTLVALLTLDEQAVVEYAHEKGWSAHSYAHALAQPELARFLKQEINERSEKLADHERVRNFAILGNDLSVEAGELTATMKIKRNVVAKNYEDLIESLYRQEEPSTLVSSTR